MKDTIFGILLWVAIIGGPLLLVHSCNHAQQKQAQRAENELVEFCSANDAIPAFKDLPADLLTFDLERSLFISEKRVGFIGKLLDAWKSRKYKNTILAKFTVTSGEVATDAFLKCTEAQALALADQYRKDEDTTHFLARPC